MFNFVSSAMINIMTKSDLGTKMFISLNHCSPSLKMLGQVLNKHLAEENEIEKNGILLFPGLFSMPCSSLLAKLVFFFFFLF